MLKCVISIIDEDRVLRRPGLRIRYTLFRHLGRESDFLETQAQTISRYSYIRPSQSPSSIIGWSKAGVGDRVKRELDRHEQLIEED